MALIFDTTSPSDSIKMKAKSVKWYTTCKKKGNRIGEATNDERAQRDCGIQRMLRIKPGEVGLVAQKQMASSRGGSPPPANVQRRSRPGSCRDTGVVLRTQCVWGGGQQPWLKVCTWNSHPTLLPHLAGSLFSPNSNLS